MSTSSGLFISVETSSPGHYAWVLSGWYALRGLILLLFIMISFILLIHLSAVSVRCWPLALDQYTRISQADIPTKPVRQTLLPPPVKMNEPITGGKESTPASFPWHIRLGIRNGPNSISFICGGSILNEIYIITAAHCLESGTNQPYVVRVGDQSALRRDEDETDYRVVRLRVHENYQRNNDYFNDIAILRVDRPMVFTSRVSPVFLPQSGEDPTTAHQCAITGFGQTGNGNSPYSNVLREASVRVISRNQCRNQMWGGAIKNTNICAGYPQGLIDACKGDSGGPLVCRESSSRQWVLQGLVSFGSNQGCGLANRPAVYTRVGAYVKWIEQVTGLKVQTVL